MRIIHLATGEGGGAAIAASRLCQAQVNEGLEAALVTSSSRNSLVASLSKFTTLAQRTWQKEPYDMSTFSNPGRLVQKLKALSPDIIHVHNWYNLTSLNELKIIGAGTPIVFTLHDQRIMTGGCHLSFDCTGFYTGCERCPAVRGSSWLVKRNFDSLHKVLGGIPNLGLISPSDWMRNQFLLASQSQNLPSPTVIPNIIHVGNPPTIKVRREVPERLRFGFISAQLNTPLKGLHSLISALKEFVSQSHNPNPLLITAGRGGIQSPNEFEIVNLGNLNKNEMSKFWSEIDILVVPSMIENFPNVIGEAASHGIPVIASRVGGIPEMIADGVNGILCAPTTEGILSAIQAFSKMSTQQKQDMGERNRQYYDQNLTSPKNVQQHKIKYEQIINQVRD